MIIQNAFIVSKTPATISDEDGYRGTVRDCHLYQMWQPYTPRPFRRRRLRRFAPLAQRWHLVKALMKWVAA